VFICIYNISIIYRKNARHRKDEEEEMRGRDRARNPEAWKPKEAKAH